MKRRRSMGRLVFLASQQCEGWRQTSSRAVSCSVEAQLKRATVAFMQQQPT